MKNKLLILTISAMSMIVIKVHGQTSQTNASDPVLESRRKEIDSLDKKLFEVLGARERVVKEIGIYKAKNNIPALQAARFQKVLEKGIEAGKKEGLSEEFVTVLLNAVHKESLRIEDALAGKKP
jgi:chorismate mutase